MPTKVNAEYSQESLFGMNMHLIKMNNGKISTLMLPIGMGKDQKRKTEKIKNLLNKCYDTSVDGNQNRISSSKNKDIRFSSHGYVIMKFTLLNNFRKKN